MNDPFYIQLRDAARRRALTADEQAELSAWLEAHPEARADWEAERQLDAALVGLPDVPVATNFTARVLRAVERDAAAVAKPRAGWSWRRVLPRLAFAATGTLSVAIATRLFLQHQQAEARQLAQSVAAVSEVSSLPSPEQLQDFEAIRQLPPGPRPDTELLSLLQ